MKSKKHGENISKAEVLTVTSHGLWVLVNDAEYFLSHTQFPWFQKARLSDVFHLKLLQGDHLYWPLLDVDLELDAITAPERYPLVYK